MITKEITVEIAFNEEEIALLNNVLEKEINRSQLIMDEAYNHGRKQIVDVYSSYIESLKNISKKLD